MQWILRLAVALTVLTCVADVNACHHRRRRCCGSYGCNSYGCYTNSYAYGKGNYGTYSNGADTSPSDNAAQPSAAANAQPAAPPAVPPAP